MQHKVIFIDDEADLCEVYEELYETAETHSHAFSDQEKALEFIKNNDVLVCFLDYRMPAMNGLELRKKIPANIPCYLLTGELDVEVDSDFVGKISKPLLEEHFETIVKDLADKQA